MGQYRGWATKIKNSLWKNQNVIDSFHTQYYDSRVWQFNTTWFGTRILKVPTDMWTYQEIIFETKPDLVIETGTFNGGSALYMAHIMDIMGKGEIITIDIEDKKGRPQHKRIQYHIDSSISDETIEMVKKKASGKKSVMVILDSDHSKEHVAKELKRYNQFVSMGNYLIVEDSNLDGNPIHSFLRRGQGPMGAIKDFLKENDSFTPDKKREKFLMTFNPSGYLKRVK
jgi:cephalosporin hydroxylase